MGSVGAHNVFVYGSLLADEVVSVLLCRVPASSAALLPDFHRFSIKGRVYPAILPSKGEKIVGKVLFGLNDEELKMLDDFEDEEYVRQIVEPQVLEDGSKLQSYTYVWADMDDDRLFGDWDYEEWRRLHFDEFYSMCIDFANEIIPSRPRD
ncbi:hypothetical protein GOP47_0014555 [Adiantum capillus-veneris]|uniref:Putative gamma-glutamylcyclotransferase n=1 Tax=Adiantum capillus-veneris TaxID=13818 RepID=A0A9D4UMI5_ADICA|nr:hypothetical protein GOP47_0014555 [Adiantum capillus-veneris]